MPDRYAEFDKQQDSALHKVGMARRALAKLQSEEPLLQSNAELTLAGELLEGCLSSLRAAGLLADAAKEVRDA